MKRILFITCIGLLFACHHSHGDKKPHGTHHAHDHDHHGHANAHMHNTPFEELVDRFESPERATWQKPELVLEAMGDLEGRKIMDIGAGTGYFSIRMAKKGAHVIAGDVDDRFQDYIREKLVRDSLTHLDIACRKLPYDSPALGKEEVDKVLIVNTYHHIENRVSYFSKVRDGLAEGGELIVIDFFKKELPVGPPVGMKFTEVEVTEELRNAGFKVV